MEEARSSPPLTITRTDATAGKQETSTISRVRKDCLSFTVSLLEGFRYAKASFIGLGKKATARNEKEATEADMQIAKMQVEAANDAENAKKKLDISI